MAIVDPQLTAGLPPLLTASTGMDALIHAIEAVVSRQANPISEGLATMTNPRPVGSPKAVVEIYRQAM